MDRRPPNDLAAFWMPFTANKAFKAAPRMFASASGMHYTTTDGRKVLDATSGLWCSNAGHCRPRIVEAIRKEAMKLDYAPSFQLGHPTAFELANRLAGMFPGDLNHVFFCNSGSEAIDTTLKIALAYHHARGEGQRTRLVGRERGYHGVGFGGISVGGIGANRRAFVTLPGVDHLPHTYSPEHTRFQRGQPTWGAHLADELERIVALHGADTIAAVIVEPLAGSTGVLPPPVGYLEKLREITKRHGILLIFDEVITAFGRLGPLTASERFGIEPDIIAVAKALTNGAVPMGAAIASSKIYDAVVGATAQGIEFFHGYTYTAHPLAVAAAQATLDTYAEEDLFARSANLERFWIEAIHSLEGAPHVADVRSLGLVAGIELTPKAGAPGERATKLFQACFDQGLLVRATTDIIALSPPLIISRGQIEEVVGRIRDLLSTL